MIEHPPLAVMSLEMGPRGTDESRTDVEDRSWVIKLSFV